MVPEIVGFDGQRPMVVQLSGSVGQGGKNANGDVKLIQQLLNRVPGDQGGPSAKLDVDGVCGPMSIAAIRKYQAANLKGFADGRVDAPGHTLRLLTQFTADSGAPPLPPALAPADSKDVALFNSVAEFPINRIRRASLVDSNASDLVGDSRTTKSSPHSGFGSPFTPSGWTINNNAGSFDASIKDNGIYIAKMELIFDADPSITQKIKIAGAFKSVSAGGAPFGFDIATPEMTSTQGKIIRGLNGFAPIFGASFLGVVGFNFAGGNLGPGGSLNFFQFQYVPAGPPGMCLGFALMAGVQLGMPGVSAGGGIGICVPI